MQYGVVFGSVTMAYTIFDLKSVRRIADDRRIKIESISNGSQVMPTEGSLLIWEPLN